MSIPSVQHRSGASEKVDQLARSHYPDSRPSDSEHFESRSWPILGFLREDQGWRARSMPPRGAEAATSEVLWFPRNPFRRLKPWYRARRILSRFGPAPSRHAGSKDDTKRSVGLEEVGRLDTVRVC